MRNNKILAFLLALLVSLGLWVYVVTVVNPDDTKTITNIPVSFSNLSVMEGKGLMLTGGEKQYISVELSGRRSDLKQLSNSNVEAVADLSKIDSAGNYEVSWSLDLPSSVASGDIGILSSSSNKVKVKVSEYISHYEIPVEVAYTGTLPEGYILDPVVLSAQTIAVSGPAEEVTLLEKAIVTLELDNLTETIDREVEYRLADAEGNTPTLSSYVTLSDSSLHLYVPVLSYKEIKLETGITEGGGVTQKDVTVTISPSIIAVSGTKEALEKLNSLVVMEIDLAKTDGNESWIITPELPDGVSFRGTQASVTVSVKFTGIATKVYTIPCADIERINDNESLDFGEQSVTVSVRGKLSALSKLKPEDIRITADMTNGYDPTTKTVILNILLPDGLQAAVMKGPYSVQVIAIETEETS